MEETGWILVMINYMMKEMMCKENEERVTDDIEVLKLGKIILQKKIEYTEKEYDERNRMDMIDDKESDERDQKGERKENELE